MTDVAITVVDLFAGAGGLSTGCARACEQLGQQPGVDVELHAINHSEEAIETHERNHGWAEHYHAKIEALHPPDVVQPGTVTALSGGPQCTHHSNARGGKPKEEQMRASAWNVLKWVEHLQPELILLENVPEFQTWASVESGDRDGSIFELYLEFFERFGYTVDHRVLNCADYGDPTSRRRLFIVASRNYRPTYPEPTHARDPDPESDLEPWRVAAEVIDWTDLGTSLWTRDLEYGKYSPLCQNTMARIADGIRRHCHARYRPLADAIEQLGTERDRYEKGKDVTLLDELRDDIVPFEDAASRADAVDEPFLVRVPGDRAVLASPYALRQQSGGVPCPVLDDPLPTVATKGAIGLANPVGRPLVKPRNGSQGDLHSNEVYLPERKPMHVVTAKNHDGHLVTPRAEDLRSECSPWIDDYEGPPDDVDDPLGTVTSKERFALCVPEAWPWGLDIRYRMLKPSELKQAQGFPPDYEIVGNKGETTAQIGNAVPVNTATALFRHLLTLEDPSLSTYGGGIQGDPDVEVPEYEEVASDD